MTNLLNKRRNSRLLWGIVIIPMVLAVLYYVAFAADRYVSQAQITVRQSASDPGQQVPGLALMLSGVSPTSREETLFLREYITSQNMLDALNQELQWIDHYAGRWRDPLYWLSTSASAEEQLGFYQRLVTAEFNEETGLLTVEVQALSPEFAADALQFILVNSERFVNELSHRMAREHMRFAETELAKARRNYEEHREAILAFQSANQFLDAEASARSRATMIAEIEALLVRERAELKALRSTLDANAPAVRTKRNLIQALEQQLQLESKRLLSEGGAEQLNVVAAQFRNLSLDAGIAEEAYKLSVVALENARIEASKKIRSLITVVSPNVPDESVYPRHLYNLLTLLIVLLLVYGITRFIIASIEDHRD